MELSVGDETHSLTLCVNMVGFGKAGRKCQMLTRPNELIILLEYIDLLQSK